MIIWHSALQLFTKRHSRPANEVVREQIYMDAQRRDLPYGIKMGRDQEMHTMAVAINPAGKRTLLRPKGKVLYGHPQIPTGVM